MIGGARAALISTVEPVYTIVLAMLLFGERLTAMQMLGGVLVIGAVILAETGRPRSSSTARPTSERRPTVTDLITSSTAAPPRQEPTDASRLVLDGAGDRLAVEHADGRIWSSRSLGARSAGVDGGAAERWRGGAVALRAAARSAASMGSPVT